MIKLRKINESDLEHIYQIGFTEEMPFWASMNAPYFDEYKKQSYDDFLDNNRKFLLREDGLLGIDLDGNIIGIVSSYWESKVTRWLELGIIIYDASYLQKGYGKQALSEWISNRFETYPEINRVGLTTWSGNLGMMALAVKLGLKEEARLRQVRYYQGFYYDSMKYGILRDEWNNSQKSLY